MKFLLVLLVVGVGLWMLTARLRGPRAGGQDGDARSKQADAAKPLEMVACAHCGVHLPAQDALVDGDRRFCSDAHRRLGPAPNPPP